MKKRAEIKKGSVLVLAVIMVVILFIIGLALIRLGLNSRLQAIHSQLIMTARTAADCGMTTAMHVMTQKFKDEPVISAWTSLPSEPNTPIAGMDATYRYNVVQHGTASWDITSIGTAGNFERVVHNRMKINTIPAVAVRHNIWLQDALFPCAGLTMQTNSTAENAVILKPGVNITGDVVCGPGGNPTEVIDTKASTVINGFTYAAEDAVDFPDVEVPLSTWTVGKGTYNATAELGGIIGDRWWGDTTIAGEQKIIGPSRIFIQGGNLTLGNGASIVIKAGASLELYLDGNLEAKNSMGLENQTSVAANLKIKGTANCLKINLKANSGSLYCDIYAPYADVATFNGASYTGSVAANSFTMDHGSSFCADSSGSEKTLDPAQGCWWEE